MFGLILTDFCGLQSGGVPSCLRAAVPNNAYGWMRFEWNRAIRLRSGSSSTHLDQTCAGDFNDDVSTQAICLRLRFVDLF